MTKTTPTPIPFEDFRARLGPIFDAVGREGRAVLVERDGALFRLAPQDGGHPVADSHDAFAGYDPERVAAAMERAAGVLAGIDRNELLRDLKAQREQDSAGRPAGA
jgi:hypothetical protein